jgi:hypothetical protein
MSVIARCEYGKTCQLLVQLFNNAAQSYQEMISNMGTSKIDISIQEGRPNHGALKNVITIPLKVDLTYDLITRRF